MTELFKKRDIEQYTDSLANYLPGGELFASKSVKNSNFRKLLKGLATELFRSNGYLKEYSEQVIPDQTEKFIEEWESALGIRDDCFNTDGTPEERRLQILTKLAALGVQTEEDFEDIALVFGKVVNVFPLSDLAFPPYDVPFIPIGFPEARFIIVVKGENVISGVPPYDVPFDLIVGESILECLFKKLKPANCKIIFMNSNN